jgi:RNA polymerase subunit RPABC4/transcription elongation factor Spt4
MPNHFDIQCSRCKNLVTPKIELNKKGTKLERLICPTCGKTITDFYNAWPGAIVMFIVLAILAYLRFNHF